MIRRFRKECDLTVAVGSAEHRGERQNPFGGAERVAMMKEYLREARLRDVRVVALRDGPSIEWAVGHLIRTCRPDLIFLSTERNRIAAAAERRVRVVRFRRTGNVSSTRIRDSIAAGRGDWKDLTGRSVVRWIVAHDGIARIRRAYGTLRRVAARGPVAAPLRPGPTRRPGPPRLGNR